jgi:hypothetical protein
MIELGGYGIYGQVAGSIVTALREYLAKQVRA